MTCLTIRSESGRAALGRAGGVAIVLVSLLLASLTAACSSPKPSPPPSSTSNAPPPSSNAQAPQDPALWGALSPIVSVQELMHHVIAPAADTLFTSVRVVVDKQHGEVEEGPKTDADWEKIQNAAVTLGEAVYLLKVRRPIAPADDKERRDATELTPPQVLAKLQKDPVLWEARIQAVRNVALEALDAVKRRDAKELWDVGENLDVACERCHLDYWYPGQVELLKQIEEKMRPAAGRRSKP